MDKIYTTDINDKFIKGFINFINKYEKLPLVIGINGEWGVGKTTLFDSIENALDNKNRIIKLSVWDLVNTVNYKENFLYELINKLSDSKNTSRKVKLTNWFSKNKIDFAGFSINFGDYSAIEQLKNNIKTIVTKKEENKIIFFIDDLDRIAPNISVELLEILKTFFFLKDSKVIFFIAFDEKVIEIGLKDKYGKENIEKFKNGFFSKLFDIYINPFLLDYKTLKGYMDENYAELYKNKYEEKIYDDIINGILEIGRKNFRDISKIILKHKVAEEILNDKEKINNFIIIDILINSFETTKAGNIFLEIENKNFLSKINNNDDITEVFEHLNNKILLIKEGIYEKELENQINLIDIFSGPASLPLILFYIKNKEKIWLGLERELSNKDKIYKWTFDFMKILGIVSNFYEGKIVLTQIGEEIFKLITKISNDEIFKYSVNDEINTSEYKELLVSKLGKDNLEQVFSILTKQIKGTKGFQLLNDILGDKEVSKGDIYKQLSERLTVGVGTLYNRVPSMIQLGVILELFETKGGKVKRKEI